jgi:hypothetical protein
MRWCNKISSPCNPQLEFFAAITGGTTLTCNKVGRENGKQAVGLKGKVAAAAVLQYNQGVSQGLQAKHAGASAAE